MFGWLTILLAVAGIGENNEIIVVRPESWSNALEGWKTHREQQGYRVVEVEPAATADATRQAIRQAASATAVGRHLVLAADCPSFADRNRPSPHDRIPTFYVDSTVVKDFGSEPTIATDYLYIEGDLSSHSTVTVGRVPVHTSDELERYLAKVIAYETAQSFTSWRREIDIVAGVGGFGAITDAVVEAATRQLLTEDIPGEYRLTMTQASPTSAYYPDPTRFAEAALQRMNDGGLFWVYLGHGHVDTLDFISYRRQRLPILDRRNVQQVSIAQGPPIAIFLACYVGAYDAHPSAIAEQLLLQDEGPVAIVAGSRVTMPYAMGILGSEMLQQCFGKKCETIGAILCEAKKNAVKEKETEPSRDAKGASSRRELLDAMANALSPEGHSIEDERVEHNYLFNLLGDPTLRILHPQPLSLNIPSEIAAGTKLTVAGTTPIAGRLVVELTYPRHRLPELAKELRKRTEFTDPESKWQAVYEAANQLTVHQIESQAEPGRFQVSFPLDRAHHGSYLLQATVYGANHWSTGSAPLRVVRP